MLVLMFTGYALPDQNQVQPLAKQNTNVNRQIETFLRILDLTIFKSYPGLKSLLNIDKLN